MDVLRKRRKQFNQQAKSRPHLFSDSRGVLLRDYLEKMKTISGEYYVVFLELMKQLDQTTIFGYEKSPYHHDGAPTHMPVLVAYRLY